MIIVINNLKFITIVKNIIETGNKKGLLVGYKKFSHIKKMKCKDKYIFIFFDFIKKYTI